MRGNKTKRLYAEAKKIIPGGTQLLSKRPELLHPKLWPAYYSKAKGCKVWDLDQREYIDTSYMGIGSCVLGYCDEYVNKKVKNAIDQGSMSTLNCPEEVELAKLLCKIHPWAHMVRYARGGGEAMAVAVRIARTKTRKEIILFCGYHGWSDWYISANIASKKSLDGHLIPGLEPKGIPRALRFTAVPFSYNDIDRFKDLLKKYKGRVAAVVMEPIRHYYPDKGFLKTVRKMTKELKITLIFDEVSSGFRLNLGGVHLLFGVNPDMAVFAKGMSNGYPMAAIIGKSNVMEAAQDTFISSTYWTEKIGPVAALATIRKLKKEKVPIYIKRIGENVQKGWIRLRQKHNIRITITGTSAINHFKFNYTNHLLLKTLFTQKMLEKGFLASDAFYVSYAHKDKHIKSYLNAVDDVFAFLSDAIDKKTLKRYLKGPVSHAGFKRMA